jgi:large repetitive protein
MVIAPTDQSIVNASGMVQVTVAANAPASLQTVNIQLDGVTVHTKTYTSAAAVKSDQYSIQLQISEGTHTLTASAADWAGGTQSSTFPVQFIVDAQPPVIQILTTVISKNDVYHPGSPMLRFRGTVSDSICLAAVQLRVGSSSFIDANLEGNSWAVAYFVNAPEGQTLSVTARAIDCSGKTAEASRLIPTDLSAPDAPDTRILSTPGNPSYPDGAAFVIDAVRVGRDVAGLMCRLDDDLFLPCLSPQVYSGLSLGQHTFRVRAIDVEGNVDETPATYTWTVVRPGSIVWMPLILSRTTTR